ncbi:MAG: cyclase family protein [Deltaproteobacteria bacterium]|nr:cyclase family protein [Deltaproteobacteria bacterium]
MEKDGIPWIDISVALRPELPVWPGDPPFCLSRLGEVAAGDEATVSGLSLGAHCGTHLDAPSHFIAGAPSIESFLPHRANGAVQVMEIAAGSEIDAPFLRREVAPGCRRVLFKTRNSAFWNEAGFRSDYLYLAPDGADFLIEQRILLVGIDYLSIGSMQPEQDVHPRLLAAGVWILEGLDLSRVRPGHYDLICLPLRIGDGEAAPARAFLAPPGTLRSRGD